ncbi:MAG TPA: sigma-70 family RNA polymerase sigma factor [Polyangiaceae bacterium]|nr:sigma-70 family RNA polymerase sigma factor [Polyangiaceae bacterium]
MSPKLRLIATAAAVPEMRADEPTIDTAAVELAQRAAAGDRAAQRILFRDLKRPMHATLYRVLGSNRQVEDLLQEAFIELFRSLPSYRGEAKLTTWADRITTRVAYRYLRRQRLMLASEIPASQPSVAGTPEHDLQAKEGVRRLYTALGALKPHYRIAFALFSIDGRSLKEVAEATGVSLIAAKSRIWRARRLLEAAARADAVLAAYLSTPESSHD